ncbi:MAG: aminoacyl-tRNA hydrolase, partial [Gemmobacter sp.]
MKLWAGLGNPGAQHAGNRHNVGFMALDRIAADHGFAPWRKAFQGVAAEGRIGAARILLLKPQTYMNLSGQSVGEVVRFHKIDAGDVCVFHDELDLAPGRVRHKQGETIIDRESESRDVYFVVDGRARVVNFSLSGGEISFDDIENGGVFGELAALDGQPRSATIVALTDTLVASISP